MAVDRTPEFHAILDEIGYSNSKFANSMMNNSANSMMNQLYSVSQDI